MARISKDTMTQRLETYYTDDADFRNEMYSTIFAALQAKLNEFASNAQPLTENKYYNRDAYTRNPQLTFSEVWRTYVSYLEYDEVSKLYKRIPKTFVF